jgi:hypothetical protein
MSGTRFENLAGRASSAKWRETIQITNSKFLMPGVILFPFLPACAPFGSIHLWVGTTMNVSAYDFRPAHWR